MFPYIKLTLVNGGEMWIHHETIAQVYFDADDKTTTISPTTSDTDFFVQESVESVVQKLKVFYPDSEYHHSIGEGVNKIIDASYLDLL